ncbi:MAG: sporulation protein YtxC [Firmicutes bacterium]|nr:sporulation protein YtxC [Bacillota bacterium]
MSDWLVICRDNDFRKDLGEYLARSIPGEWEQRDYPNHAAYQLTVSEPIGAWMLGQALAQYLVVYRAGAWLRLLLQRRYRLNDLAAEDFIVHRALDVLTKDPERVRDRLNWTSTVIFRHLQKDSCVVVDGVQWFLLHDVRREFEEALDEAFDAYLLDQEYQAFVEVLRQLVREASQRVDWIHVHFQQDRFFFETSSGDRIGDALIQDIWDHAETAREDLGDVLVSALVTLAPHRVTIHRGNLESAGRDILLAVFGGSVLFCRGCSRCYRMRVDTDLQSF